MNELVLEFYKNIVIISSIQYFSNNSKNNAHEYLISILTDKNL